MHAKTYCVYILANRHRTIYVGVTSDLVRRIAQHRTGVTPGFTKRYKVDRLVYFECTSDVRVAIHREKELKGWVRRKKVALIEETNPDWKDLSVELAAGRDPSLRSG